MKKGQRTLFDDPHAPNIGAHMPEGYDPLKPIGGTPYPTQRPPVMDDPFASPFISREKGAKIRKAKKSPPAYIPPIQPGPGGKQIIYGVIPSKSNCYVIITMKPPKDSDKKGHASLAKSAALKRYENDFYIQCNQYRNKMIDGYFQVEVDVYYPNQRSDLDNSLKVLLDCLQKVGAFKNDNKCTRIVANKFLDPVNPRIEFEVKTV